MTSRPSDTPEMGVIGCLIGGMPEAQTIFWTAAGPPEQVMGRLFNSFSRNLQAIASKLGSSLAILSSCIVRRENDTTSAAMIAIQEKLLLTERGQKWLSRFSLEDREAASRLVRSLTLVSHSAFHREMSRQIVDAVEAIDGPVALYAAREMKAAQFTEFTSQLGETGVVSNVNAVAPGSDLGSEAKIAAMIRSLCRSRGEAWLNHPNIGQMRAAHTRAIIVVDDLIGSGNRIREYLGAFWANRSIRSWWSRKQIRFIVITFAATDDGAKSVTKLKVAPKLIYNRVCPTLRSLPWSQERKSEVSDLCIRYGTHLVSKRSIFGYQGSAALMVFEHGCPNNVPAILWARPRKQQDWEPLFPEKSVLPPEDSAFPPEIVNRTPTTLLVDIGQNKLAARLRKAPALSPETILILAYAEKGVRTTGALSFATGLDEKSCRRLIQLCVEWGFLTSRFRLTSAGASELKAAQRNPRFKNVAPIGTDNYYPNTLRQAT